MSVATDFRTWLLTQTTVTKHVGDRICQLYANSVETLPYVIFRRSGRRHGIDEGLTMDGDAGADVTTLDVEVCGTRRHDLETIADAIRDLISGFPQRSDGELIRGNTWNSRVIQYAEVTDANDEYEYMPPAAEGVERSVAMIVEVISDG